MTARKMATNGIDVTGIEAAHHENSTRYSE